MATKKITMVDPMQIVRKGYKGCNSSATVKSFAIKNHVPCCWWKPTTGPKVLLIEMSCFQSAWKAMKSSTTQGTTSGTTSRTGSTRKSNARGNARFSAKSTTTRNRSSWNRRSNAGSQSTARSSARRTTSPRRLRRAA